MLLVLLSQLFGTFPFDRRGKISVILLIYSISIFLLTVYASPLYVKSRLMQKSVPTKFMVRSVLETANTAIHLFVWLSQLKAALTCHSSGLVFVKGKSSLEPLLTVLVVAGAASIEVVLFDKFRKEHKFYLRFIERMVSVGATRSVQCLILMQFIKAVNSISSRISEISKAKISDAISLQKVVINDAKKLNEFYQTQLVFCTASIFITLSSESYNIMSMVGEGVDFSANKNKVRVFLLFEEILWVAYAAYWLLRVVISCESFYEKMEILNGKIYNTVKSDENEKCKEKNQLQVIKQPSFLFTACRFFPIGYSLITSVIGAATTYLVILLDLSS